MVGKEDLERLLEYNIWANHRMMRVAVLLPPDDFARDLAAAHRSVRGTLLHIMQSEWTWFDRWQGIVNPRFFREEDFQNVLSLRERWVKMEDERRGWFKAVPAAALTEVVRYTLETGEAFEIPLWKLVQHMTNDSSHYRGHLAVLYRQLGLKLVSTDLLAWDLNRDGPWGGSAALGPR